MAAFEAARQKRRRGGGEVAGARQFGLAARHATKMACIHAACTVADDGTVRCVDPPPFDRLCPLRPAAPDARPTKAPTRPPANALTPPARAHARSAAAAPNQQLALVSIEGLLSTETRPRSTGGQAQAASTARTWAATSGAPGNLPSKMAPPMVKPQAPARDSDSICSKLVTEPAAMTGPELACTTALVSSSTSTVPCRYASRSKPTTPSREVIRRASSAISSIVPSRTLGWPTTRPGNGQYRTLPPSSLAPDGASVPPSTQSTPIWPAASSDRRSSSA